MNYAPIINDVGACPLSLDDAVAAMKNGDCMCLGLYVQRPEAAIADPSRLQIVEIFPTYLSADSFLESAQYQISKHEDAAHGGFGQQFDLAKLALGVGRQNITGIMPLFLFKEHWEIARRKV